MGKFIYISIALIIFFSGCSPSEGAIETALSETLTERDKESFKLTEDSLVGEIATLESKITTESAKPTASPSKTPLPSLTNTTIPTDTPLPTNTSLPSSSSDVNQTENNEGVGGFPDPIGDGFYTVGVEISPGKWHSTGTGNSCYWKRLDSEQETIDYHYGLAGGTVNILETDYEVSFDGCGTWEYTGP